MNVCDEWFLDRFYIKTFLSTGKYYERNLDLDPFFKGVGAIRHKINFSKK